MKKSFIGLSMLTLALAVGCTGSSSDKSQTTASTDNEQSEQSDKPQKSDKSQEIVAKKPVAGESDNTFSLSVPFESVTLTQGEEKSMLIGINRGEDFREEVSIEVSGLPMGVTLETEKPPVIKRGDTDAALMLKAAPDASVGDFTIKVNGQTASSGADFSKEVKLTVTQK